MDFSATQGIGCRAAGFRRCCLWLLLALLPLQLYAAPPPEEYQLKAALIYKLSKFVDWPASARTGGSGQFGICVLGEDPFGAALDALAVRKTRGRTIRVERFTKSESIQGNCQILFIAESKRAFLGSILKDLQYRPILTLGDTRGFAEKGGIVELTHGRKRIGFKINLVSARQAGLKISAPLLELATVIGSRNR